MTTKNDPIIRRTFAVIVDNEPGVLSRVVGLFSGRGYNIESLTVTEVDADRGRSRITIITNGTYQILEQIENLLRRLVPVHKVQDLTTDIQTVERELAMVKVVGKGEDRVEALRLAQTFGADVVDASLEHFVFELHNSEAEVNRFIDLMRGLGLVEICRSGVIAVARGKEAI